MRPAQTLPAKIRNKTDHAVAELVRTLEMVLCHAELCDDNTIRRVHFRLRHDHPSHPVIDILVHRINRIVTQRKAEEADRSALSDLCRDLAKNRRFRSTAVMLSRILQQENLRHADASKAAYEQEIIRLVESGAIVNCGPVKASVITTNVRGRTVKVLVGAPIEAVPVS